MASTVTLQNSINWAKPFLNYAPLTIGVSNEPAITSANTVLQTMLMAPFNWRWNRGTAIITTVPGQQDYPINLSNYGHFELATVGITGDLTYPLEYKSILGAAVESSRPTFISDQLDNDAGFITFRITPAPDKAYAVTVTFQNAPPIFSSLSSLWSPVPDWMAYVYNWGFLALMSDFVDQSKAPRFRQMFVGSLLAASEGLSEEEKNVFKASWLGDLRQMQGEQMNTQSGWKGRTI
jgi:hypothetical protein